MRTKASSTLLLIGSAIVGLVGRPTPARAVPRFPGEIIDYFKNNHSPPVNLDYTPPCRLCHIDGTTGSGSVQTPFGISMLAHGLTEDRGSITTALEALDADGIDSDGDGVPDISELSMGTDPNSSSDAPLSSMDPSYGCAVASPRRGAGRRSLGCGAVLMAVLLIRRRRARQGRAHQERDR
ncbi:MAG TPA: hypothetical protein VHG72_14155 [Polyangia bacterium]|nr:hypothetical protein [Polyangia bacterium]